MLGVIRTEPPAQFCYSHTPYPPFSSTIPPPSVHSPVTQFNGSNYASLLLLLDPSCSQASLSRYHSGCNAVWSSFPSSTLSWRPRCPWPASSLLYTISFVVPTQRPLSFFACLYHPSIAAEHPFRPHPALIKVVYTDPRVWVMFAAPYNTLTSSPWSSPLTLPSFPISKRYYGLEHW